MIFTVCFVTTVVVTQVGDGREGIGEMEVAGLFEYHIIDLGEGKLLFLLAVYEDTVLAGGVVITQCVILHLSSHGQCGLGVEMRHRVYVNSLDISEFLVNGPYVDSLRNLFVLLGGVVVKGIECTTVLIITVKTVKAVGRSLRLCQQIVAVQQTDGHHCKKQILLFSHIFSMRNANSMNLKPHDIAKIHMATG